MINKNSKIYVAGHKGLVGSAILRKLKEKNFINITSSLLGIKIRWRGKGIKEKAYDQYGKCIIKIDKKYFRPNEVNSLLGNSLKAKKQLKWKPKFDIKKLIKDMINYEYFNDK